jgi:hypothetical protein
MEVHIGSRIVALARSADRSLDYRLTQVLENT